jgi:hypothetical protein
MERNVSFTPSSQTRKSNTGEMGHNHITEVNTIEYFGKGQSLFNQWARTNQKIVSICIAMSIVDETCSGIFSSGNL